MAEYEVDVVVVGLGPGGEEVAGRLAEAGLDVVGVDERLVGGECPYFGCIPTKMIVRAAGALAEARRVDGLAGTAVVTPDFTPVADRIRDAATDDWDDRVAVERLAGKGGRFARGHGVLEGPGRVRVGEDVFVARRGVVLNTGTSPAIPPVPGLGVAAPWTNRDVVHLRQVPRSLIVLGGGAIGVELAQALARFGSAVTIVETADRLVAVEEPEASALLARVLGAEGLDVRTGVSAESVRRDGVGPVTVALSDGSEVTADEILVAAGRTPNVRGIGLASIGLDEASRTPFALDGHQRATNAERLWVVGDIAGRGAFTHMSMQEAGAVVDDLLGVADPRIVETHAVPRVTFTDPEIGSVGLTEAQARAAGLDVRVGVADSSTSSRGWIHGPGNDGLMKLVADTAAGVLVGATSAGPCGGEVLSMFTLAVHARVPLERLRTMIYAYPTFHRGALDALAALG